MAYRKKTWQEKMADRPGMPKILTLEESFPCYNAVAKMGAKPGDSCVLVNHSEVEEIMRQVPKGRLITIREICGRLAEKHGARACCTLTTGIGITTAANAAEERKKEGKDKETPYWRTLKANGFLNEKYPGGAEAHKALLEKEGIPVAKKGKRYCVKDYQEFL
jgi:alkylated DNA nucleotide flippase Atl1